MQLSKDADKLVSLIYKSFLEKRKSGDSRASAKHFKSNFYLSFNPISNWNHEDIIDILYELKRAGFIKLYLDGGFQLHDEAIIYMENRFKNGLNEVTDFISKFIP